MANKEDSSPEEIKTNLLRKYQYQNVLQQQNLHTSQLAKCRTLPQNESTHDPTKYNPSHILSALRENASTVINKATGSKNAEDANKTKSTA